MACSGVVSRYRLREKNEKKKTSNPNSIAALLFLFSSLVLSFSPNQSASAHQVRLEYGVDHAGAGEERREGDQVGLEAEAHREEARHSHFPLFHSGLNF